MVKFNLDNSKILKIIYKEWINNYPIWTVMNKNYTNHKYIMDIIIKLANLECVKYEPITFNFMDNMLDINYYMIINKKSNQKIEYIQYYKDTDKPIYVYTIELNKI